MTDGGAGAVRLRRDGGVLRVVLDRPGRRNAADAGMIAVLVQALEEAAVDDTVRAIELSGAGEDFCSGVDWVSSNDSSRSAGKAAESPGAGERPRAGRLARRIPLQAHRVIELLHEVQVPVVCVVRGWAAGFGLGLALAADFTVATADARFWAPFTDRGFTPDSGTTWAAARLVGVARAKELLMLGKPLSGEAAAAVGLIYRAVNADELDSAAGELVAELAGGPTGALGLAKRLIDTAATATVAQALRDEAAALEIACRTADFKEGLQAFVERRPPEFRGR